MITDITSEMIEAMKNQNQIEPGFCYEYHGFEWKDSKSKEWVITITDEKQNSIYVGSRIIDGNKVRVFKCKDSVFRAQIFLTKSAQSLPYNEITILRSKEMYGDRYAKVGDPCLVKISNNTIVSAVVSHMENGIPVVRSAIDTLTSPRYKFCDLGELFCELYHRGIKPELPNIILNAVPNTSWFWNYRS